MVLNIMKLSPKVQILMLYTEIEITLACPMSFKEFPFDIQTCDLNVMEMRLTNVEDLIMKNNLTGLGNIFSPFEPTVREFEYTLLPAIYSQYEIPEVGKTVSNAGIRLLMKRNYSKYYIMYYIPTSNIILFLKRKVSYVT